MITPEYDKVIISKAAVAVKRIGRGLRKNFKFDYRLKL